ncbi:hypothetical protein COT94_00815 [Candidatus Falkowbacteria bacterium CG10_big_fil_rev_8_21_14_0_10_37_14]|uniref:Hydrogenase n=1 Tax=Candidatus Falkowbacteria bacterium CG10_big_fil_rev_8_21_14_0_10_37_14 TaxID=1974561 RepID=A0A2M6WU91_9BACT|nr:hypothetical protein [Candidatus Falkowbacteria bacterium]PIT96363.1 MAG: hypothetical protein COT94_00815 [Candidatus Falkowbacteria bacterium CG10_big_fil_rev_8_21_14_0_10_37_14]
MNIVFLQFLLGVLFLTIIFLHLSKKNSNSVLAYGLQSLVMALIMFDSFLVTPNFQLLLVIMVIVIVKVVLAPVFFMKLLKQHQLTFLVNSYLNIPLTLITLTVLTAVAHSTKLSPLTTIIPNHQSLLALALAAMLVSVFLIINRKGALSQALGILSLENSLVVFGVFAGLEQSPILQIGVIFDILIWLVIATVFISMIYKHFGSLDTSLMKNLRD